MTNQPPQPSILPLEVTIDNYLLSAEGRKLLRSAIADATKVKDFISLVGHENSCHNKAFSAWGQRGTFLEKMALVNYVGVLLSGVGTVDMDNVTVTLDKNKQWHLHFNVLGQVDPALIQISVNFASELMTLRSELESTRQE